jgi:hypothetical protein
VNQLAARNLIADVAREIVADIAPDELDLFDVSAEAYLDNPDQAAATAGDEMLGFGGGAELEMMTPVVLSITSGVVAFLVNSALTTAKAEGQAVVQEQVRQLFRRFRPRTPAATTGPSPLSPKQLAQVRQVALDVATRMQVAPEQARLLADATVGQLVLAR